LNVGQGISRKERTGKSGEMKRGGERFASSSSRKVPWNPRGKKKGGEGNTWSVIERRSSQGGERNKDISRILCCKGEACREEMKRSRRSKSKSVALSRRGIAWERGRGKGYPSLFRMATSKEGGMLKTKRGALATKEKRAWKRANSGAKRVGMQNAVAILNQHFRCVYLVNRFLRGGRRTGCKQRHGE